MSQLNLTTIFTSNRKFGLALVVVAVSLPVADSAHPMPGNHAQKVLASVAQPAVESPQVAKRNGAQENQSNPANQPRNSAPSTITGIHGPAGLYKYPDGLTYFYDVDWRLLKAGVAILRIEAAGPEQRVVATADSLGVVGLLYKVHDRFESFFDSKTFCTLSISKHVEEGFRRVETNARFDYVRGKSIVDERNLRNNQNKQVQNDIPRCVTGVLAAAYFLSAQPLAIGSTYSFPMNDGGTTVQVEAHVEARETIKIPAGSFQAVRVQPRALSGPLRERGKVWFWYSDDPARMLLQVRTRMAWGTLTLRMQHIERH